MDVTPDVLVIGIGNPFRGDDGIGIRVAREVQQRALPGVVIMECAGEGAELFELLRGRPHVVLIDAVDAGAAEGTVIRLDCLTSPVPHSLFRSSSHTFGVAEAIALARVLGELPEVLVLHGMQTCRCDAGADLSAPVVRHLPHLLACIERDLLQPAPSTEQPGVCT